MFQTVEMPIWALILMGLLAAITAASHLLFPSVRWFFRRRAERVVNRLNTRLKRPIQPFKLAARNDMLQNILYDPGVISVVNAHAAERRIPENVAFETAQRYAREIVPSFSATIYFGLGARAAKWLARALYRVRVVGESRAALDEIDDEATVIYIMNHRSNMDYVLVTYLAAGDSAISYAVGEWARGWPLRPLVKMMGGYFIRRRSLNPLYRRVLARYVELATREGVTQAIFPEGGLSRSGELGEAKLGLLRYVIDAIDPEKGRDVVFVPVGLNYDRVIEDRFLVAAQGDARHRFKFRISGVLRYVARHLWQRVTGRFHRMGFAAVAFGQPLSLRQLRRGDAALDAEALGAALMERLAATVPVLPVPLLCHLIRADAPQSRAALAARFVAEIAELQSRGVALCLPRAGAAAAVEPAFHMLEARGLVTERDGAMHITSRGADLAAYYAQSVKHIVAT